MAQLTIDPLKYLERLPYFDGKTDELQGFCDLIDRIFPFLNTFDLLAQPIFVDLIKSKLKNHAKLVIDINCQAASWPEIKNILINNFSDKKSCEELYDDLRLVAFKTNCVDFYNELREKLRRLNNKTLVVVGTGSALNECTKNNRRSALNFFVSKIPEPMKSILVCRDPENMEEAMDILFKAGYAYYGKEYTKSIGQNQNLDNFRKQQNNYNRNSNNTENYKHGNSDNRRSNNQNFNNRISNNFNRSNNNQNFNHGNLNNYYRNNNNQNLNNRNPNNYNRNFNNYNGSSSSRNYTDGNSKQNNYNKFRDNNTNNLRNGNRFDDRNFNRQVENNYEQSRNLVPPQEPMEIGYHDTQTVLSENQIENFSIDNELGTLPYIVVNFNLKPLKFIIDTGATHSIVNPGIFHPKYKSSTAKTTVKTLQHLVEITEKIQIPLFKELGNSTEKIELLVCRFHNNFDGLLGNNVLKNLKVKINYEEKVLSTIDKFTEFFFQKNKNELNVFTKKGNSVVSVPVAQSEGLQASKYSKEYMKLKIVL